MATMSRKEKLEKHHDELTHNIAENVDFLYLLFIGWKSTYPKN
ncbi:hypothetical protein ADIWIN_2519 [Winogradskyella psychrotolerans RS-3]|uniref:Uncharacterized protein n=1 Tax=Winogradskyella psychrotolerans RS-3 TaxID=641526 RepID=S7X000_9FLAO|nr:hypothetical protein ADIWIN_2519 [Winogradskyella psychrotolerans RS-3]